MSPSINLTRRAYDEDDVEQGRSPNGLGSLMADESAMLSFVTVRPYLDIPFAALPEGADATEIPETEQVWPQVRSCLAAYLPVSLSLCVSCRLSLAILLHACLSVCLPSCLSVGRSIFLRYPLA